MQATPTAMVTGSNRGIGLAMARQLGERGYLVWLGCRDQTKGERAADALRGAGIDARSVPLDVTDDASVRAAADHVAQHGPALDLLINNAGMNFGPPGHPSDEDLDQVRTMFEINTLGPVRVTRAFLPLLRRSEAARIVMITSGLGSHANTIDPTSENWDVAFAGYSASKSALNMFALKFARELLAEGIKVNVVDPGLTDTPLGGPQAIRSPEEAARAAVELATTGGASGSTGGFFVAQSSDGLSRHPW